MYICRNGNYSWYLKQPRLQASFTRLYEPEISRLIGI